MDLSKLKTSDWLKIGGAIGFFIFGFFHWTTVSAAGFGSGSGNNVFDFFLTGTVPWLLVIATGVLTVLLATDKLKTGTVPWPLIMLIATGLAALLLLIRLLFNPVGDIPGGVDVGRGIGLILSAISGFVAFAGAVMGFKESGGEFSDLTDMDKIKASFGGGSSADTASPPPPPPPGMTPPPPPPPPA